LQVSAECLKLIGNGSFGYNGLEASNYDTLKLLTGKTLARKLEAEWKDFKLKNLTLLGIVRQPTPIRRDRRKKNPRKKRRGPERGAVARLFWTRPRTPNKTTTTTTRRRAPTPTKMRTL
jgi:hypothetical protein